MSRKGSLKYQLFQKLESMKAMGESRHADKKIGADKNKIYSYNTYNTYKKTLIQFEKYCKDNYNIKNINDINNNHIIGFLNHKKELNNSAWSLQTHKSALNKVFNTNITGKEAGIPIRHKEDIKRSRELKKMDNLYSFKNNADAINVAKATGARRESILKLKKEDFKINENGSISVYLKEKGGRERYAKILPSKQAEIKAFLESKENGKLFNKYSKNIDNHQFRREYAQELYKELYNEYKTGEEYKGYDAGVIKEVSENLGHSRLDIVVKHYLE